MWLAVAKILWAFDIQEIEGKPVDADYGTGYSEGFLCCAKPFEADVRVRGERRGVIEREFESAEREVLGRYESE